MCECEKIISFSGLSEKRTGKLVHANELVIKIKFLQPSNNETTNVELNPNRLYQLSNDRTEILLKLN